MRIPINSSKNYEGLRLKGSTAHIYLCLDGQLRWIPNYETYANLFVPGFVILDQSEIDQIPKGPQLMSDAYLLCDAPQFPGTVYLIDNLPGYVEKRQILDPDTMKKYGFNSDNIIFADSKVAKTLPTGKVIKS